MQWLGARRGGVWKSEQEPREDKSICELLCMWASACERPMSQESKDTWDSHPLCSELGAQTELKTHVQELV